MVFEINKGTSGLLVVLVKPLLKFSFVGLIKILLTQIFVLFDGAVLRNYKGWSWKSEDGKVAKFANFSGVADSQLKVAVSPNSAGLD